MNNNPGSDEELRKELGSLGAREFEIVALTMEPERGLAALRYAISKKVDHPLPYAIAVFDNPDWVPPHRKKPLQTNISVDVSCEACGGHRMVVVDDGPDLYGETYAPCAACNPKANTIRYIQGAMRRTAPR